jgi:predicted phosphodiesterase
MRRLTVLLVVLLSPQSPWLRAQDLTLPLKPGSVRFAAIGDMGTGDPPQYQVAQRMLEFRQKFPFTFAIMLGDNIYGGKSPQELRRKFEIPYKPLMDAGVQFYAALGNHDDTNERFYKFFNMNGQQYYSFKKGNVQFFVLDSNYMDPKQLAWLEKELGGSKTDWKICYFHHPLYSSGAFHGSSTELRAVLEPLFVKYGVQVVFAGHEHMYERVKPQKGIYHFTEGASGELRAGNLRKTDFTAAGYDKDRSFLLVEIGGDDLYFQAISRTGLTIDSGTIKRPVEVQPRAPTASLLPPAMRSLLCINPKNCMIVANLVPPFGRAKERVETSLDPAGMSACATGWR